jgi:hypothetical protein
MHGINLLDLRPIRLTCITAAIVGLHSSVGIALGYYGLDDRGSRVRFPAGLGIFSLPPRPERL